MKELFAIVQKYNQEHGTTITLLFNKGKVLVRSTKELGVVKTDLHVSDLIDVFECEYVIRVFLKDKRNK